jgi:hypothetical protein
VSKSFWIARNAVANNNDAIASDGVFTNWCDRLGTGANNKGGNDKGGVGKMAA